jgi:hypothetical protein
MTPLSESQRVAAEPCAKNERLAIDATLAQEIDQLA